ncbi:MAG TPA: hypothetical protein VMB71_06825 [Acetobacteraceae bacterium]|nr:hypothetical protein [Acetobacteraceae bacterium]
MPRYAGLLPLLLLTAGTAQASTIIGRVEGFTPAGASGWACTTDGSSLPSIAAYAGNDLIGVYPEGISRPDVIFQCPRGQLAGFSLSFDAGAAAEFAWRPQISLYAVADGASPLLLPSLGDGLPNPMTVPVGTLAGVNNSALVTGTISAGPAAPQVRLYLGGPAGQGLPGAPVTATPAASGGWEFALPVPSGVTAGALLPVFGTAAWPGQPPVPLTMPLPLVANGTGVPRAGVSIPLQGRVAQHGSQSGITNTVFSAWVQPGLGLAGLSGRIGFIGNDARFSEALVALGTIGGTAAGCAAWNGVSTANPPSVARFWSGILKNNSNTQVDLPANFALPNAVVAASAATGTCVLAELSAGYVFLDPAAARYTTTALDLRLAAVPAPMPAVGVVPFGLGGEFRFHAGTPPLGTYVGLRAARPLALDGLAITLSAAPAVGAPASSGWLPAPAGAWSVQTDFVFLPAGACTAGNFMSHPANGLFAVLHSPAPAPMGLPGGAVILARTPMSSFAAQPIQRSTFRAFMPGALPSNFPGTLAPGDCLLAYQFVSGTPGYLDVENQTTAYLRPVP